MNVGRHKGEQFVRYLLAGIVNTAVTYAVLLLAMHWMPYLVAYTVVYAIGIMLGYWLQSRFVFGASTSWRTAVRFPLVYVVQYAVGAILLWILLDAVRLPSALSAFIVVAATVPVGFVLSRLIFRTRGAPSAP
jgi:putative flippase GtrA